MEFYFSWEKQFERLVPSCCTKEVNNEGYSPLACLLVDDGGVPFLDMLPWYDECLSQIHLIKKRHIDSYYWGREDWAAELSDTEVRIYSQLDETCFEFVKIDDFEKLLLAWRSFIQSTPQFDIEQKVVI
ncbi:hypothetical protein [Collimonas fungivorans]|uniref:hypothetical protein n=1 Tax=Collimonas fungivorans TaxID=158899 RepID=UPI000778863B|nr:hypothetical protein [Collimonas fungivorans]